MGGIGDAIGGVNGGIGQVLGSTFGGIASGIGKYAPQNGFNASSPGLQDPEARARYVAAIQAANQRQVSADPFYQAQLANVGQLQQTASGQGPSVAGTFLNQAQQQNVAAANALASSGRGDVNPALLQRNAMMAAANNQQALAGTAAQAKAQEALNAQTSLGNVAAAGRTGNVNFQQAADQTALGYEGLNQQGRIAELNANMDAQRTNAGISSSNLDSQNKFTGAVLGAAASGGAAAAASDERVKKDIHPGDDKAYAFLDALKAHTYKYKEPEKNGSGEQLSVMAQELEKAPGGKQMVKNTSEGKIVDYGKGFGAILAAQAAMHDRLKKLESKK